MDLPVVLSKVNKYTFDFVKFILYKMFGTILMEGMFAKLKQILFQKFRRLRKYINPLRYQFRFMSNKAFNWNLVETTLWSVESAL